MPYHTVSEHSECPASRPVAVVKDSDGEVMGCHANRGDAERQIAAIESNEAAENLDGFLAGLDEARRSVGSLEETYTDAVSSVIRAAGRRAASRFLDRAVTLAAAAGDPPKYVPPNVDEVVSHDDLVEDANRKLGRIRRRALELAAGTPLDEIGLSFDVVAPFAVTLLDRVAERTGQLEDELRTVVSSTIQEGFVEGRASLSVGRLIEARVEALSRARAVAIARTELNALANGGSVLAAKASGVSKFKRWLTAGDDRVRDTHVAASGQTVPIDATFSVGGSSLAYPGDPAGSLEETMNCRCTVTYTDSLTAGGTPMRPTIRIRFEHLELTAAVVAEDGTVAGVGWRGMFVPEGVETSDRRFIEPGALTWRDLPLTLMGMIENSAQGHQGAQVAGRIDDLFRDGNEVWAAGIFDRGEFGTEVARLVDEKVMNGVSVDLAIFESELRAIESDDAPAEEDEPDLLEVLFGGEDMMFVVLSGEIMGATVCPFPAFADASIETVLAAAGRGTMRVTSRTSLELGTIRDSVLTAAAPARVPRSWFANPELREPTPLRVENGRVFGHAALWNVCHTAFPDRCVLAPRNRTGYPYFHLGEVETDDGDRVAVGQITLGTGHAPVSASLGRRAAAAHYDNTGTAVADVRAGDDQFGIWVAGAVRDGVSDETVRELAAAKLSGDWRGVDGRLEMIGLLAVNVPGFPVPRPQAAVVASGMDESVVALVAAGVVDDELVGLDPDVYARKIRALAARATGGVEALAALVE